MKAERQKTEIKYNKNLVNIFTIIKLKQFEIFRLTYEVNYKNL